MIRETWHPIEDMSKYITRLSLSYLKGRQGSQAILVAMGISLLIGILTAGSLVATGIRTKRFNQIIEKNSNFYQGEVQGRALFFETQRNNLIEALKNRP